MFACSVVSLIYPSSKLADIVLKVQYPIAQKPMTGLLSSYMTIITLSIINESPSGCNAAKTDLIISKNNEITFLGKCTYIL